MTDARQEAKRNNIKLLKEANKILVLQCIMKLAPISTEEILKHTGLSRPTVINLLKELTDEEIVTKAGILGILRRTLSGAFGAQRRKALCPWHRL